MQAPINNDAVYVEDGVEYHAVTQPLCTGPHGRCAFFSIPGSCSARPCEPDARLDGDNVIFVRAE